MSKVRKVEFRCRRCDKVHGSIQGPSNMVQMSLISVSVGIPRLQDGQGITVAATTLHSCEDGGLGLADLIGATPERDL